MKLASESFPRIFSHQAALPYDHGSWVFLFSPLLIGLFLGGRLHPASFFLIVGATAGFLLRQPVTMVVKVYSGRRPRADLPAAWFWLFLYGFVALAAVLALVWLNEGWILFLAFPAGLVFAWHLRLVSRRSERHQIGVEIVASGALALAAPAAYWIGQGHVDGIGWLYWILCWLQSAASIVHAALRLEQRKLNAVPGWPERLRMGRRAWLYTSFNMIFALVLAWSRLVALWLPLAFLIQWLETLWGIRKPAIGVKPVRIGFRQLIVSTLFTIIFLVTARI